MDKQTRKEWEQSIINNNQIPPMASMLTFLESLFRTLESIEEAHKPSKLKQNSVSNNPTRFNKRTFHLNNTTINNNYCPCCQRRHPLYKCCKLSSVTLQEENPVIQQNNICSNCLRTGHSTNHYTSKARCQQCKQKHHTIHSSFITERQNT